MHSIASSGQVPRSRSLSIDTLRGVACLMLVAFHVIGVDSASGLEIGSGVLREVNDALGLVRMPLFTFLSGLVYSARPFDGRAGAFVRGKVRRLLIPMLAVGTGFAVLQAAIPGTHEHVTNWWTLHLVPVAHYWFIEALFLIFVCVLMLERAGCLRTPAAFAITWIAGCALSLSGIDIEWLGINGALFLLPFFLLGLGLGRFLPLGSGPWTGGAARWKTPIAIVAVVVLALAADRLLADRIGSNRSLAGLFVGSVSCVALLWSNWRSRFLARIGRCSYAIYLYHVFFTAGVRIVLHRAMLGSLPLDLVLGLTAGIALPMALQSVLEKVPWAAVLLLGQAPRTRRKSADAYPE